MTNTYLSPCGFQNRLRYYSSLNRNRNFALKILPGCDCCLRRDPKTGKEYLVADGTTWVMGGKIFGNRYRY